MLQKWTSSTLFVSPVTGSIEYTVLRNAYALCNMCHLQVLKTFDSKIAEYTFPHLDSKLGLRHVMATEFIAADKKIWGAVSQLHAKGSTLEESIHEMTVVWSDISSLVQPRPKVPKALPQPREPNRKGKGKGAPKGSGKGKTKSTTFSKNKNWCTWGFHNNQ